MFATSSPSSTRSVTAAIAPRVTNGSRDHGAPSTAPLKWSLTQSTPTGESSRTRAMSTRSGTSVPNRLASTSMITAADRSAVTRSSVTRSCESQLVEPGEQPCRLLGRLRPHLVGIDAGRHARCEHPYAVDVDVDRPHPGGVGEAPRIERRIRPRHPIGPGLGNERPPRLQPSPRKFGRSGEITFTRSHERQAELVEHVGTDAVG